MYAVKAIKQWQIDRGLASMPYDARREIKNIVEELLEGIGRHDDEITEWATNNIFMHENIVEPPTEEEIVDSWADIIVFAIGSLLKLGYEPELVLKEVYKEINSRDGVMGLDGKWQKNQEQDPATLYKSNFSTCKRKMQ